MNEIISIRKDIVNGQVMQTVNARELHAFLEVGKVFAAWIQERIAQYGFEEALDYVVVSGTGNNPQGGRPTRDYHISIDMAKELSMVERNRKGKQARQYFIECERKAKESAIAIPNFSDPAAAARAWAEQYEARQIAERTKAEIGSRREATAMNTASQAVKQANKLAIELDRSKQYASVKRMSMLYHGQKFDWRLLREVSANVGKSPIDVFDANYGTVKAYHADAWREAYALEIEQEVA